jgi:hypothetical protein
LAAPNGEITVAVDLLAQDTFLDFSDTYVDNTVSEFFD